MTTDNSYVNQFASSLSESVMNLAKVGYADQFITNGVEAYRGGEQIAHKVADLLPRVRENRREFTAYFDDPSGRIVEPVFRRFDYETQRNLSRLARDYFVAGSDNKTRRSLVDGHELLATALTPADMLEIARQRGVAMPAMVVEKALPGQRGLLVRTNLPK